MASVLVGLAASVAVADSLSAFVSSAAPAADGSASAAGRSVPVTSSDSPAVSFAGAGSWVNSPPAPRALEPPSEEESFVGVVGAVSAACPSRDSLLRCGRNECFPIRCVLLSDVVVNWGYNQ